MSDQSSRLRRLATLLEREGWRIERRKKGWQFFPANGSAVITAHETPGPNTIRALTRDLRARGYEGKIP